MQIIAYHFQKHLGEKFNVIGINLANYSQHFGFQATGAKVIDFSDIHLAEDERPEDLYQRLVAFVEDSLLHAKGLTHHGEHVPEDEELTPTLANFVVLTWSRLTHPSLPR